MERPQWRNLISESEALMRRSHAAATQDAKGVLALQALVSTLQTISQQIQDFQELVIETINEDSE